MNSAKILFKKRLTPILMAFLFLMTQVASTAAIALINMPTAEAVSGCVNDTAGANDEPGQKDLTRLCVDETGLPNTMQVVWNWDDLGTTGNNTMDACGLFDDSDADVNADYSICIITGGTPATIQDVVIYSCGNGANDKCTQQRDVIAGPYDTTCTVTQQATDPFPAGASSPTDTVATCTFHLADLNVQNLTDLELTDVCSYPSSVPGSDPSDCVIIVTDPVANVEVVKDIVPNGDSGLFNLSINGPGDYDKTVANQGDGGTTGKFPIIVAKSGNTVTVSETAGTSTNLADYTSSISCVYRGTTTQVAGFSSISSTSASFTAKDGEDILCTITNTKSGSITIVKNAVANSLQDFAFTATGTGVSNFTLDDDNGVVGADNTNSESKVFNNLGAGTYTFTETAVNGWYLDSINCPNITESQNLETRQVSLTITAGQNVTCTFENRQLGQIKVTKQTDPNGDPTSFAIAASPSGGVVGNASQNIVDDQTVTYVVKHGTYAVNETVPAGWSMTSNTCSSMVIDGNTPKDQQGIPTRTCLINNTKLSTLTIIKDAVPNSAQDFIFSTTGTGLSGFILDDDADAVRSNQQEFSGLMPGSYSVTEQTTTGWSLTGLACTGTGADYDTDDNLLSVTLTAGQNITCTFTNTQLGSISGIKFNDLNNNGVYDEGEPALSSWNIFIDTDGNGELDPGELSMITDSNGFYQFVDLLPSSYNLFEVMQTGWTQTLSPATVELSAGENVTDQNFGNFQSGSISGYKFNDVDGNTEWDEEEPALSGWIINLYNDNEDKDNLLNNLVATDTTDTDGYYEFLSVPAGVYQVCEEQQDGWNQTFPTGLACHTITIDQSGETNSNMNFGNQGVGTITVKKDVDTDGDGVVNDINSAEWTFDIDGTGDYVTGSTVGVAAGTYEVSEDQKEDYSVVGLECKGEGYDPSEKVDISVAPGEDVVCTFTNARDTGTITVNKVVNPTDDDGTFDLQIDGQVAGTGDAVSNGGTTGAITVPTGNHNVSEIADGETNLGDYASSYECSNEVSGSGTLTPDFNVSKGDNVVCTFTNVRYGKIIVEKQTLPDGSQASFSFNASYDQDGFSLTDGQTNDSGNLLPGEYSVSENVPDGWDLTGATCSDRSSVSTINLAAGEVVTCTFTNTQRGSISGTKYEVNSADTAGTDGNELSGWLIEIYYDSPQDEDLLLDDLLANEETDGYGNYSFERLVPGEYKVCEVLKTGYTQIFPSANSGCYLITLQPGQSVVAKDFGNFQNGSITGYKFNDLNGNGEHDDGEPKLSGWEISLYIDQALQDTATTTAEGDYSFNNLAPGTYVVCETQQDGWQQTAPDPESDACHEIEINESGENASAIFGNQGRGSITINKNVDVNGDGDLDDQEDVKGSTDWYWDLDGTYLDDSSIATGSTKSNIPADTYTITETQKDDHHFVSVECTVNRVTQEVTQAESFQITVNPGDNVVCKFTNARDTGFIVVEKQLEPADDQGVFDLNVNDTEVFSDAGDGDASEPYRVVTGSHTVSEEAGNIDVDLGSYATTYICIDEQDQTIASGDGSSISDVSVESNQTVTCTFTNTKRPSITIVKDAIPDHEQDFEFTTDLQETPLVLDDDGDEKNDYKRSQTYINLVPDEEYDVAESAVSGWELTNLNCEGSENWEVDGSSVSVTPEAGENVVCTFENTKLAKVTVIKDAYPDHAQDFEFKFGAYEGNCGVDLSTLINGDCIKPVTPLDVSSSYPNFFLDDDDDETLSNTEVIDDIMPGEYMVEELPVDGWRLYDIYCDYGNGENGGYDISSIEEANSNGQYLELYPGAEVTCTFINVKDSSITIVKDAGPNSTEEFSFSHNIEGEESEDFMLVDDGVNADLAEKKFVIKPGIRGSYFGISEADKDGWILEDFSCSNDMPEEDYTLAQENGYYEEFDHRIAVRPGEDVTCTFVNKQLVLNLEKSNNKPEPTVAGDVVTYTLVASIPQDAADLEDVVVTDLPPENFGYIPGTYTAVSSTRGNLVTASVTGEPTYASPGDWELGNMMSGEIVTLTYQAKIADNVTPGIYPDIAFVRGIATEATDSPEVLGNLTVSETPFVGTDVEVIVPVSTEFTPPTLVETGQYLPVLLGVIPAFLLGLAALAYRRSRRLSQEGGQR